MNGENTKSTNWPEKLPQKKTVENNSEQRCELQEINKNDNIELKENKKTENEEAVIKKTDSRKTDNVENTISITVQDS